MSTLEALLLLCLLIVISASMSCSEFALTSACKIKLQAMAKDGGDTRALDVFNMQQQPGGFITVVQVDLDAVVISVDIVGEVVVRPYFDGLLVNAGSWGSTAASLLAFTLVIGGFILIANLMPKRVAMTYPEVVAVRIVRSMMFLISTLKPFILIFDGLANVIFKFFKISTVCQEQLTLEDIYAVADVGVQAGALKEQEHYPIKNISGMRECKVTSTMNTREYIVYFDRHDSSDTVLEMMPDKSYNKFPVCDDDLERVIGYIESHTLLTLFSKGEDVRLTDKRVLCKVLFIPDTLSFYDVLGTFETSGEDFVIIANEYVLVVGVVTLRDVMSVVMGELVNTEGEPQIIHRTEDTWLVDGATPLIDVMCVLDTEEFLGSESYETTAGFMMYSLCKIPERTDLLVYVSYKFEIIDIENLKIDQLLVSKQGNMVGKM